MRERKREREREREGEREKERESERERERELTAAVFRAGVCARRKPRTPSHRSNQSPWLKIQRWQ